MQNGGTKSFGIAINRLSADQKSYIIIEQLNRLAGSDYEVSPILFFLDYAQPLGTPLFARMQMKHLIYFEHPVIATCLETAKILINSVGPSKRFLYLWDLDWLYGHDAEEKYSSVYREKSLNLIVRCLHHASLVQKCWLVDSSRLSIVEDFNYEEIRRICGIL